MSDDNVHRLDVPYTIHGSEPIESASMQPGNVVCAAGRGLDGQQDGVIRFETGNKCLLELRPTGDIFVNGRLAKNDELVYAALRSWVASALISQLDGRVVIR